MSRKNSVQEYFREKVRGMQVRERELEGHILLQQKLDRPVAQPIYNELTTLRRRMRRYKMKAGME